MYTYLVNSPLGACEKVASDFGLDDAFGRVPSQYGRKSDEISYSVNS